MLMVHGKLVISKNLLAILYGACIECDALLLILHRLA